MATEIITSKSLRTNVVALLMDAEDDCYGGYPTADIAIAKATVAQGMLALADTMDRLEMRNFERVDDETSPGS